MPDFKKLKNKIKHGDFQFVYDELKKSDFEYTLENIEKNFHRLITEICSVIFFMWFQMRIYPSIQFCCVII